jgi:hypothetical protein
MATLCGYFSKANGTVDSVYRPPEFKKSDAGFFHYSFFIIFVIIYFPTKNDP